MPKEEIEVEVRVRLRGGHSYDLTLSSNSALLRDLITTLGGSRNSVQPRLFQLPLDGGQTSATFASDQISAIDTRPPLDWNTITTGTEERSAKSLGDGPPLVLRGARNITRQPSYEAAERRARRLMEPFVAHRQARRAALKSTCDELGGNTFVVSPFNQGFVPLLRNWAASCDRSGIDCRARTVLFPTDNGADTAARELGFATLFDGVSFDGAPRDAIKVYGDAHFADCVFAKLGAAIDMLALGYDILLQDMDLVWFKDPLPGLKTRAMADDLDLQFMRDMNPRFQPLYYNSGFVFMRNNEFTRQTWNTIFDAFAAVVFYRSDQTVVNQVVDCYKERGLRAARLPDRYVDGQLLIRAQTKRRPLPPDSIVAHVNWTGNLAEKIARLKALELWFID